MFANRASASPLTTATLAPGISFLAFNFSDDRLFASAPNPPPPPLPFPLRSALGTPGYGSFGHFTAFLGCSAAPFSHCTQRRPLSGLCPLSKCEPVPPFPPMLPFTNGLSGRPSSPNCNVFCPSGAPVPPDTRTFPCTSLDPLPAFHRQILFPSPFFLGEPLLQVPFSFFKAGFLCAGACSVRFDFPGNPTAFYKLVTFSPALQI